MQAEEASRILTLRSAEETRETWRGLEATVGSRPAEASFRPPPRAAGARADAGFAILDRVGGGGMGEVYRAQQAELEREVALKVLKPELASRAEHRSAFFAEAVVAGRLEHPNIVPVYTLGERQRDPFIAMKLVGGRSWRELLEDGAPAADLPRHLEILIQVCNAVAFAHSRGIVHADLKPANVMLGDFGEVILLDWGLAVSVEDHDETSQVRFCGSVTVPCGTPAYMAPELAMGAGECIGPWTDIYLLGGILHRLLTGAPPHRGRDLEAVLAQALDERPVELPASAPAELAALCRASLQKLPRRRLPDVASFRDALRAYLEHRASFALAARAEQRLAQEEPGARGYDAFAEAVHGFREARAMWPENPRARAGEADALAAYGEAALERGDLGLAESQLDRLAALEAGADRAAPLRARLATARARLRRRERTRRLLQGGLVGCTLLLVGALTFWAVDASARRAEIEAKNRAILQRNAEIEAQKRYALDRGEIAVGALTELQTEISDELLDNLSTPAARAVAGRILEVARRGWQQLRDADLARQQVSLGTAVAHQRIGNLLIVYEGEGSAGLQELTEAVRVLEGLPLDSPGVRLHRARSLASLGIGYYQLGRLDDAHDSLERSLALLAVDAPELALVRAFALRRRGIVRVQRGDLVGAVDDFSRSLALYEQEGAGGIHLQDRASLRLDLAEALQGLGELERAAVQAERAAAACRGHLQRWPEGLAVRLEHARSQGVLCALARARGDAAGALAHAEAAVADLRALHAARPGLVGLLGNLLGALNEAGLAQRELGQLEAAEERFAETVARAEELPGSHDRIHEIERLTLCALRELGALRWLAGDMAACRALHERGLALALRLAARDASDHFARRNAVVARLDLADAAEALGDARAALDQRRAAVAAARAVAGVDAQNQTDKKNLAVALTALGVSFRTFRQADSAALALEEALELHRERVRDDTTGVSPLRDLQRASEEHGTLLFTYKQHERAARSFAVALDAARRLVALAGELPEHRRGLFRALHQLGNADFKLDRLDAAEPRFREALALAEELCAADSTNILSLRALWQGHNNLNALHVRRGARDEALPHAAREVAVVRRLVRLAPEDLRSRQDAGYVLQNAARLQSMRGAQGEAEALMREALDHQERSVVLSGGRADLRWQTVETRFDLASLRVFQGDLAGARAWMAEVLALAEELADADPAYARMLEFYREQAAKLE